MKKPPNSVMTALLRLEAKQVLRGFKSEIFPDLTPELAMKFRLMTLEELEATLNETEGEKIN